MASNMCFHFVSIFLAVVVALASSVIALSITSVALSVVAERLHSF